MEEQLLKQKRLRVTSFRIKVLEIINASDTAISVNELEDQLGEHDRVTLYRTLKAFVKNGVIHEILMPGEPKKLAPCDPICEGGHGHHEHNHIHFHCTKCKEVYCIEQHDFPTLSIPNFQIEEMEVQAKGVCEKCL